MSQITPQIFTMICNVFSDYFYNARFAKGRLVLDIFRSQRRFTQQGKTFDKIGDFKFTRGGL